MTCWRTAPILATVLDDLEIGATAGGLLAENMGRNRAGAHSWPTQTPPQRPGIRERVTPGHPIVGMLKFAPSLTPEGQRAVTVLVLV